jgi:hypothetical protein
MDKTGTQADEPSIITRMISPPNEDCNTLGLTPNPLDFFNNCMDDFSRRTGMKSPAKQVIFLNSLEMVLNLK